MSDQSFSEQGKILYITERFRRPSKQLPLQNEYTLKDFQNNKIKFHTSYDVIKAYFGLLRSASNMDGYIGGCGSIGNAGQPYPYAYDLLSETAKERMSLSEFINSYQGIGYITLLKLYPAFVPLGTPATLSYYMFEMEAITGPTKKEDHLNKRGGSYFFYQYGLITVTYDLKYGWKIDFINTLFEDFLCAPEHGWSYSAQYIVMFVYKDWYQLIEYIYDTKHYGNLTFIYASKADKKYRFDFVQLTNGYDILLHENILHNGIWIEINLLKDKDQGFKLSILNPKLEEAGI